MKVAAAVGILLLSASPAFCDLIPNPRHAPLVILDLNGSPNAPSSTEALMEGALENNAFIDAGTATTTDSVTIDSNGGIGPNRSVLLPTSGVADLPASAVALTPEPGTLILFGLGAILAGAVIRRKSALKSKSHDREGAAGLIQQPSAVSLPRFRFLELDTPRIPETREPDFFGITSSEAPKKSE